MQKILLVEDDLILVQMYEIKFKHAGYDVQTAFDGEQGLEKMRNFKPDLVLLDIMMPKINGKVFIDKVKQDQELKNIPIAILTNVNNPQDRIEFMRNGAEAFFIKSDMTPEQIVEGVKAILNEGPAIV